MIRIFKHISLLGVVFTALSAGLFLSTVGVAKEVSENQPAVDIQGGLLSSISADAFYIFDLESQGKILARHEKVLKPIASVTKLLSAAMFFEHASVTEMMTVQRGDIETDGRSGRLQAGQQYQNKDLLFPVLMESSNDAASAMNRVASVDLVGQMNQYALEHQLLKTYFTDTSGLGDGNVSTAYELGKLSSILYREYPHVFDITRLKTYVHPINAWMNNNPFVHSEGYVGGKHGYTYAANRTAVAFFDEELESGQTRTIGYVLLGSDTLHVDMERLREYVVQSVVYK